MSEWKNGQTKEERGKKEAIKISCFGKILFPSKNSLKKLTKFN